MLDKIPSVRFTYESWRNSTLLDAFGIRSRIYDITIPRNQSTLREHAIGWNFGSKVPFRPKPNTRAVMFFNADGFFWNHLEEEEFNIVFNKCI